MTRAERTQLEKSLVGPAGEHYVLFRLYEQGMLASLAPPGAPTVDILVMAPDETVVATLQVKTRTYGADGGWHMSEKHERFVQPRCFYALVDLEPSAPVTYLAPSRVVADVLAKSHRKWLSTPGKRGQRRKDTKMRRIRPSYPDPVEDYPTGWLEQYRERWDFLSAAVSSDAPPGELAANSLANKRGRTGQIDP